jgi:hypothetical protein
VTALTCRALAAEALSSLLLFVLQPVVGQIAEQALRRRLSWLQAEKATKLEHAEEIMRQNALDLNQRPEPHMAAPHVFLNMNMGLLAADPVLPNMPHAQPAPGPAPELLLGRQDDAQDNTVRCTIM